MPQRFYWIRLNIKRIYLPYIVNVKLQTLMKNIKSLSSVVTLASFLAIAFNGYSEETNANSKDTYPLQTCVVSGEKLGEMGKPYIHTYEGKEVRFCCKGCLKDFNKAPAKYIKKLNDATAAAKK